jgi:hypothetical protein
MHGFGMSDSTIISPDIATSKNLGERKDILEKRANTLNEVGNTASTGSAVALIVGDTSHPRTWAMQLATGLAVVAIVSYCVSTYERLRAKRIDDRMRRMTPIEPERAGEELSASQGGGAKTSWQGRVAVSSHEKAEGVRTLPGSSCSDRK